MQGFTKFIVILLGVLVITALILLIVAQTKNMSLVDFVKSWFETSKESATEATKSVAQAILKI